MMRSDFFALSSCAFSVLYAPFLIVAQMRFSHIMQNTSYSTGRFFLWVKNNFWLVYAPLIGICLINAMAEVVISAYLSNTALYYLQDIFAYVVIVGFMLIVAATAVIIAVIFRKYVKCIKIEGEITPLICSKRLVNLFLISCFCVCALITLENVFIEIRWLIYFTPLTAPLFVPLVNKFLGLEGKQAPANS